MVKFIHCADLHLDSPFRARQNMPRNILEDLMESTYKSVTRMIDFAIEKNVDFILIVGDVFDNQNRTLKSEVFLKNQFKRLEEKGIFVFMSHGNHDPLSSGFNTSWPQNVNVFLDEVETFELTSSSKEQVFIHGFSYYMDDSYENKLDYFPKSSKNQDIHIGMLHGTYSKSNYAEKRYTEFTLESLNEKLYNYWALGHIHKRHEISDLPPVVYPGNMQGRHKNESGEKGFIFVEGNEVELKRTFVPTQEITFVEYEVDTSTVNKQELYTMLNEFKNSIRDEGSQIVKLTVQVKGEDELNQADYLEIMDLLKEDETDVETFIWIDEIDIRYAHNESIALLRDIRQTSGGDESLFKEALNSIYMDPKVNRFLEPMDSIDKESFIRLGEERLKMLMRK